MISCWFSLVPKLQIGNAPEPEAPALYSSSDSKYVVTMNNLNEVPVRK